MLLLFFSVAIVSAFPAEYNSNKDLPKLALQNPDLYGGDILESIEDLNDKNVIPGQKFLWPNAVIPYVIDSSLLGASNVIQQAFDDYHNKTCVRFIPRTDEKDYIRIFSGSGCYSNIGKSSGIHPVSLGPGCIFIGTIVHELGHVLGFWHEHNRYDRDNYLEIYFENVIEYELWYFEKLLPFQNLLLSPFDYDSIMIYGNDAFSKNGQWTIKAKNGQKLTNPYEKPGLNTSDAKRVNILYKCK